jgi:hypothetical protein
LQREGEKREGQGEAVGREREGYRRGKGGTSERAREGGKERELTTGKRTSL